MQPIILTDHRDAARFQVERFSPVAVAQTVRMKVVLTLFPAQFISVHPPRVDMAIARSDAAGLTLGVTQLDEAAAAAGQRAL